MSVQGGTLVVKGVAKFVKYSSNGKVYGVLVVDIG
jgi:tryptophan synthase alpha subunit